jgi:hypothetical protein
VGEVYGRLTITGDAPYRTKDRRVFVQCECGNTKDVLLGDLRKGDTVSCGCYLKEQITTHGDATSRLYKIYRGMLNRCYLPTIEAYANYGGRGITVCDAWRNSYEAFRDWALANGYADDLTIDRKEVDGHYEPSNCQWIPKGIQQRNKRAMGTTGYVGVSHCKQTGRWIAMIKVNGKQKNLGRYSTPVQAAQARNQYILDNQLEGFKLTQLEGVPPECQI